MSGLTQIENTEAPTRMLATGEVGGHEISFRDNSNVMPDTMRTRIGYSHFGSIGRLLLSPSRMMKAKNGATNGMAGYFSENLFIGDGSASASTNSIVREFGRHADRFSVRLNV